MVIAAGAVVLPLAVVGALLAWAVDWSKVDRRDASWGDVPTWCGFVAAVVAGTIALGLFYIEFKRDRDAQKERDEQAKAERQTQANKVAAWFARNKPDNPRNAVAAHMPPIFESTWVAWVANGSDLPVYDVTVRFFYVQEQPNEPTIFIHRATSEVVRVVPPQDRVKVPLPEDVRRQTENIKTSTYVAGIDFRDTAGVRWRRDERGALVELP